eukprot:6173203-Pleurochrysis_carterae.AAC.4
MPSFRSCHILIREFQYGARWRRYPLQYVISTKYRLAWEIISDRHFYSGGLSTNKARRSSAATASCFCDCAMSELDIAQPQRRSDPLTVPLSAYLISSARSSGQL